MNFIDQDGDELDVEEAIGEGLPALIVGVVQDGVDAFMNLDVAQARHLIRFLQNFVTHHERAAQQ